MDNALCLQFDTASVSLVLILIPLGTTEQAEALDQLSSKLPPPSKYMSGIQLALSNIINLLVHHLDVEIGAHLWR